MIPPWSKNLRDYNIWDRLRCWLVQRGNIFLPLHGHLGRRDIQMDDWSNSRLDSAWEEINTLIVWMCSKRLLQLWLGLLWTFISIVNDPKFEDSTSGILQRFLPGTIRSKFIFRATNRFLSPKKSYSYRSQCMDSVKVHLTSTTIWKKVWNLVDLLSPAMTISCLLMEKPWCCSG